MSITETVLTELEKARADAQSLWSEFAKAREDAGPKAVEDDKTLDELDKIHEKYRQADSEVKRLEEKHAKVARMDSVREPQNPLERKQSKAQADDKLGSWGEQFIESEQYKTMHERRDVKSGPIELKTTVTEGSGSAGPLIQPDVQGGILSLLFKRLTLADLMPSGTTDSNVVRYLKETTATNAAATVAEGAAKPESTLVFAAVDEPVQKIATFLPVSDEMLEDYAAIRSYIDARLRLFVQLTEEDQLLNGSGTPPDITGILNRSGKQSDTAVGTDSVPDAIYKAVTKIRVNAFLEPDGLVVHPNDWQDIRLGKDANQQYYGGGPFTGQYGVNGIAPDSLWGLRVVITPTIAQNTALVGSFAAATQVFRKGGITVESSNSHNDFFQKNLTAIRAEERLALAVYRPGGLREGDGRLARQAVGGRSS
jgi:HK97 family phage major capsid protein